MTITVYAASSGMVPQIYVDAAKGLGSELARRGHTLVNGAGRMGLMAAVADSTLAEGGKAVGVIPQFMIDQQWQHTGMTELVVTPGMHERKQCMAERSDACIALPGGVGTLEELLEIITWKQLGIYLKPVVVLNANGYFDPLLAQLGRAVEQQMMRPEHQAIWQVAATPEEAVKLCETTQPWDKSVRKFAAL